MNSLIDWCFAPTLAVFQLYRGDRRDPILQIHSIRKASNKTYVLEKNNTVGTIMVLKANNQKIE
jgi:hypothetical protein